MMQNKVIIGLTGGSGAGKGEVAKVFESIDAQIIDADAIAHRIIRRGESPAYECVIAAFGKGILGADNEICRRKLREIVFANKIQLKMLEDCVHPVIIDNILQLAENSKKQFVVIDAPLLIPSGLDKICHVVVGVFAPLDVRIARICQRDGISADHARLRIDSQMLDDGLRRQVDFVLENGGGLEELDEKVIKIIGIINNSFGA